MCSILLRYLVRQLSSLEIYTLLTMEQSLITTDWYAILSCNSNAALQGLFVGPAEVNDLWRLKVVQLERPCADQNDRLIFYCWNWRNPNTRRSWVYSLVVFTLFVVRQVITVTGCDWSGGELAWWAVALHRYCTPAAPLPVTATSQPVPHQLSPT